MILEISLHGLHNTVSRYINSRKLTVNSHCSTHKINTSFIRKRAHIFFMHHYINYACKYAICTIWQTD